MQRSEESVQGPTEKLFQTRRVDTHLCLVEKPHMEAQHLLRDIEQHGDERNLLLNRWMAIWAKIRAELQKAYRQTLLMVAVRHVGTQRCGIVCGTAQLVQDVACREAGRYVRCDVRGYTFYLSLCIIIGRAAVLRFLLPSPPIHIRASWMEREPAMQGAQRMDCEPL